jgi:hypothetical protein
MNSQCLAADPSDLSLASDILLREQPEDEEDDEENGSTRKTTAMRTKATRSERVLLRVKNET